MTALLKDLHLRAAGMTKHAEAAGTTKRRPLHVVIDVRGLQPVCRARYAVAFRCTPQSSCIPHCLRSLLLICIMSCWSFPPLGRQFSVALPLLLANQHDQPQAGRPTASRSVLQRFARWHPGFKLQYNLHMDVNYSL